MKHLNKASLLILPFLACLGCSQSPPPPVPVPPGVRVELYEVVPSGDTNTIAAVHPDTGAPLSLKTPPLIKTAEIDTVQRIPPDRDDPNSLPDDALGIHLAIPGAMKMKAATTNASGQEIALFINGKIVAVAQVRSQITDSMVVTGGGGEFEKQIEVVTDPR